MLLHSDLHCNDYGGDGGDDGGGGGSDVMA